MNSAETHPSRSLKFRRCPFHNSISSGSWRRSGFGDCGATIMSGAQPMVMCRVGHNHVQKLCVRSTSATLRADNCDQTKRSALLVRICMQQDSFLDCASPEGLYNQVERTLILGFSLLLRHGWLARNLDVALIVNCCDLVVVVDCHLLEKSVLNSEVQTSCRLHTRPQPHLQSGVRVSGHD